MSRQYDHYIFTLEEPEQICRGNAKRFEELRPPVMTDPRTQQQLDAENAAREKEQDEYLKSKGVI